MGPVSFSGGPIKFLAILSSSAASSRSESPIAEILALPFPPGGVRTGVSTRSRVLWALGGAGAILVVEVTVLSLFFVGVVTLRQHPHPTPSPVVIPSPVAGVDASRFHEYSIPKPGGTPYAIVATPDGSIWFTESECTGGIGRMTKEGTWDNWPLASGCGSQPLAITIGPRGNVWYGDLSTGFGQVGADGTLTRFELPQPGAPLGIALGPDGNVWIAG